MITGRQIREARALLRWSPSHLASRAKLSPLAVERAESLDDVSAVITTTQAAKIEEVLRAAGIKFSDEGHLVRLVKTTAL